MDKCSWGGTGWPHGSGEEAVTLQPLVSCTRRLVSRVSPHTSAGGDGQTRLHPAQPANPGAGCLSRVDFHHGGQYNLLFSCSERGDLFSPPFYTPGLCDNPLDFQAAVRGVGFTSDSPDVSTVHAVSSSRCLCIVRNARKASVSCSEWALPYASLCYQRVSWLAGSLNCAAPKPHACRTVSWEVAVKSFRPIDSVSANTTLARHFQNLCVCWVKCGRLLWQAVCPAVSCCFSECCPLHYNVLCSVFRRKACRSMECRRATWCADAVADPSVVKRRAHLAASEEAGKESFSK